MSLFRDLLIEKKRKPYYCEVEYLESSGTQYIDTGFKIDDTCGYDISWMALNANDTIIMGTKGAGDSRWVLSGNNNPNVNLSWNINYGRAGLGLNKIQTSQMNYLNGRKRVLNGIQITDISETLSADASTYSVCIFGGYWGSGTASLYSTCRLYYAKITKGLTLVRDLIPVLDWSMTPCMYDKVSGKLFYNAGTGTFTYGREIHYVDYLEATGTQYIDTGFKMENGKTMTFNGNIMWTQSDGSANFFYGYRSTNSATYSGDMRTFFIFGSNTATPGALAIRYGYASNNSQSDAVILNTKHNISFDGTTLSVDGSPKASVTGESQSPVYENMWLFDCNTTGYYSAGTKLVSKET